MSVRNLSTTNKQNQCSALNEKENQLLNCFSLLIKESRGGQLLAFVQRLNSIRVNGFTILLVFALSLKMSVVSSDIIFIFQAGRRKRKSVLAFVYLTLSGKHVLSQNSTHFYGPELKQMANDSYKGKLESE